MPVAPSPKITMFFQTQKAYTVALAQLKLSAEVTVNPSLAQKLAQFI